MIGGLPETLTVGGMEYPIRTDYRSVLQMFEAFQDPDLYPEEKQIVSIYLLFEDFTGPDDVEAAVEDGFNAEEAVKQIAWFIAAGRPERSEKSIPTYNWIQDEQMIFAAVNKVAGTETRELTYLHWWTFLGYFNEIGEGTFSFIVGIRDKLNNGKKLEEHEKEFIRKNRRLVELRPALTEEEQKKEDEYKALLDEVLG